MNITQFELGSKVTVTVAYRDDLTENRHLIRRSTKFSNEAELRSFINRCLDDAWSLGNGRADLVSVK